MYIYLFLVCQDIFKGRTIVWLSSAFLKTPFWFSKYEDRNTGGFSFVCYRNLSQSSPVTDLEWPTMFQEVKVPRFHDKGTGWW